MTAEQLVLIPPPAPRLTDKQQALLDAVAAAGLEGLGAAEGGAVLHALKEESRWTHTRHERCQYCSRDGNQYLRRLRQLGHVRYAGKLKVWVAVGVDPSATVYGMLPADQPLPY